MDANRLSKFMAKVSVEPNTGCWLWDACTNRNGYGKFWDGKSTVSAHRISYEHYSDKIGDGLVVDHLCRTRSCVNPEHMEPVTNHQNVLRGRSGELARERNLARTHCKAGHPFRGDNLHILPSGKRRCRKCDAIGSQKYRDRKKA